MISMAHRDIAEIVRYTTDELAEPAEAAKQVDRLESAIASLTEMLLRSSPVVDQRLAAMGIRKLLIGNCLVFCTVSECAKTVTILRVLHSRRYWADLP
jgi:toxin ParE1/3/4